MCLQLEGLARLKGTLEPKNHFYHHFSHHDLSQISRGGWELSSEWQIISTRGQLGSTAVLTDEVPASSSSRATNPAALKHVDLPMALRVFCQGVRGHVADLHPVIVGLEVIKLHPELLKKSTRSGVRFSQHYSLYLIPSIHPIVWSPLSHYFYLTHQNSPSSVEFCRMRLFSAASM